MLSIQPAASCVTQFYIVPGFFCIGMQERRRCKCFLGAVTKIPFHFTILFFPICCCFILTKAVVRPLQPWSVGLENFRYRPVHPDVVLFHNRLAYAIVNIWLWLRIPCNRRCWRMYMVYRACRSNRWRAIAKIPDIAFDKPVVVGSRRKQHVCALQPVGLSAVKSGMYSATTTVLNIS
jgi:hypothetical protein